MERNNWVTYLNNNIVSGMYCSSKNKKNVVFEKYYLRSYGMERNTQKPR